jgi:putative copper export protein
MPVTRRAGGVPMSALIMLAQAVQGGATQDGGALDGPPARSAYVLARAMDYVGTGVFLGGLFFIGSIWPTGGYEPTARRILTFGWFVGFAGTVAAIGLQGAWISDLPPASALDPTLALQVLDMRFGTVWLARALFWVLCSVLLAWLLQRGPDAATSLPWRVAAVAVGIGLLRTSGLTGHATDARRPALAQAADLLHVTGIAVWFGGLVMLLSAVLPRRDPVELARVVPRYSRLAMGAVAAIVIGGAVLTWQVVGSMHALTGSSYGHLLIVKIAMFGVIMILGQLSKTWVTRRLDFAVALRGDALTVRPFVYSITAEAVLIVFVLFAASFLVTANPGH